MLSMVCCKTCICMLCCMHQSQGQHQLSHTQSISSPLNSHIIPLPFHMLLLATPPLLKMFPQSLFTTPKWEINTIIAIFSPLHLLFLIVLLVIFDIVSPFLGIELCHTSNPDGSLMFRKVFIISVLEFG
ncbi:hypothetical protein FRB95_003844 [Tulasnella sp. JGI-2019a]|nr:hypothetical protein FRB95_003844 [Tulasnella sp. JGI-2019a]